MTLDLDNGDKPFPEQEFLKLVNGPGINPNEAIDACLGFVLTAAASYGVEDLQVKKKLDNAYNQYSEFQQLVKKEKEKL